MKPLTEEDRKKWLKRAAMFGFLLGLLCHVLPPQYRTACKFLSDACTGGF